MKSFIKQTQLERSSGRTNERKQIAKELKYTRKTHLHCLIFQWMIRIGNVFQCDTIELSFIYVCDAIIFASL